jgi:hypothetical protein
MTKTITLLLTGVALLMVVAAFTVPTFRPLWHPIAPPASLHNPSPPVMISHISGGDYWHDVAMGRRLVFDHDRGIGVAWETDASGAQIVNYVPTCQVFDPSQQTAGYRQAVEELIEALARTETRQAANERLESLTGNRFSSSENWRTWLSANSPFLYFSTSSMQLKVDFGAAAIGQSTKISWKTCDMPPHVF